MRGTVRTLMIAVIVVVAAGAVGRPAAAQEKKQPIRFEILNTFQTDLSGVEKAQFIEFQMDPGAEVKNFKVVSEVLWVTKGVFTYAYRGSTVERKAGDSWFHNAGTVIDVANRGHDVAILRGVQFIRAKK